MLALSSSCLAAADEDPSLDRRIATLLDHEVEGYELDERTAAGEIEAIGRAIRGAGRRVTSLHGICPAPRGIRPSEAGGDRLPLTSEDGTLRERGVGAVVETIEWAARLEAGAVVVRAGRTPVDFPERRVEELLRAGRWSPGEGEGIIRRIGKERAVCAAPALDRLRRSLDRVLRAAERFEVAVLLENRARPDEVPSAAEFAPLLATFRGAPLGTRYDTGSAWILERLGFALPGETWEALRGDLRGCRVHDLRGIEGGLPPGEGELDLGARLGDLPRDIPLVIACRPGLGRERIAGGVAHLARALGRAPSEEETGGAIFFG